MSLHPQAVPGAEYAPIPVPPYELCWRGGYAVRVQRSSTQADQPGPHQDPGLGDIYEPTPRIADLRDADTAILVLRRMLATPRPPVRAHALGLVLLGGTWTPKHATQLGELCRRVWGPIT